MKKLFIFMVMLNTIGCYFSELELKRRTIDKIKQSHYQECVQELTVKDNNLKIIKIDEYIVISDGKNRYIISSVSHHSAGSHLEITKQGFNAKYEYEASYDKNRVLVSEHAEGVDK